MPIDRVTQAANAMKNDILSSYASLFDEFPAIDAHIEESLLRWQTSTRARIGEDFPLLEQETQLNLWRNCLEKTPGNFHWGRAVDDYVSFCKKTKIPANEAYWRQIEVTSINAGGEIAELPEKIKLLSQKWARSPPPAKPNPNTNKTNDQTIKARLMLDQWRKEIDKARVEWELAKISELRRLLFSQLEAILKTLQELKQHLGDLMLDLGVLFDLSKGSLMPQNIEQLKKWTKYLAEDPGVRSLCDLMGRLRQIELSERIERVKTTRAVSTFIPAINSREEIIGIRLGRDLEHALPNELALLADPDSALLFDVKYIESRLMCFDMQGLQATKLHTETEEDQQSSDKEKQGPIILCIDTSGSMMGAPETIAKAMALFMTAKAKEQKRACYLINFSTNIQCLDLINEFGMNKLLDFLRMSFHGGTDAAPALIHAIDLMKQDNYKKADLLMVSDFVLGDLPENLLASVKNQRLLDNKFYSLVVGDCYMTNRLHSIFDQEWVYNPKNSTIHELVGFRRKMEGEMQGN